MAENSPTDEDLLQNEATAGTSGQGKVPFYFDLTREGQLKLSST